MLPNGKWRGPYSTDNIEVADAESITDIPYVAPVAPVPTQQDINDVARRELEAIDMRSVRSIREFILLKFADDPDLPVQLADHELAAVSERQKLG